MDFTLAPIMRMTAAAMVSLLLGSLSSCGWSTYDAVVRARNEWPAGQQPSLAPDNEATRYLVESEERRQRAPRQTRNEQKIDEELAQRPQFLKELGKTSGMALGAGTDLKISKETECRCTLDRYSSAAMVSVEVISGPNTGATGWICDVFVGRKHPAF
jgi:hypothetical protein